MILAAQADPEREENALGLLKEKADAWRGSGGQKLSLAVGYALGRDNPELNAEELARRSDLAMYASKAEYYQSSGRDRRRRR